MKKILFISNISNKINLFAMSSIIAANKMGFSYHHASNWSSASVNQIENDQKMHGIIIHNVDITRFPFSKSNYNAYRQIVDIIQREKIDYIHCNTPTGGLLGRLAGRKCKISKVIYQAHGFHFYKGAPIINWLIYYPIERWLAHYTDALITINQEDLALAKEKMHLRRNGKVYIVPGVGIDVKDYERESYTRDLKRQELGISGEDVVLISMGDLIARKNYGTAIRAIAKVNNSRLHYLICGRGPEQADLRKLAKELGIASQVHFLGFRSDIKELLAAADIFLFTTLQEGLPRSMMEAMASGLPCVASKIRGNVDLIRDGKGGFLRMADDVDGFAEAIKILADNPKLRTQMSQWNLETIKGYDISIVEEKIKQIYCEVLENGED